jgi:riboflavin transporter FmnP
MKLNQRKKRAVKEAVVDTIIGTLIMAPLNFIVIYVCLELLSFNALQITIATTSTLFLIAVARKAYVRLYFEKRYESNRDTI